MKYIKKFYPLLVISLAMFLNLSCKKKEEVPSANVLFYTMSVNFGCLDTYIYVDGVEVGFMKGYYSSIEPQNCNGSNTGPLLVSIKKGVHEIKTKTNCSEKTVKVNINSDCFLYKL